MTTISRRLSESGDFIDVYRRRKVHTLTLTGLGSVVPPAALPTAQEFLMAGRR